MRLTVLALGLLFCLGTIAVGQHQLHKLLASDGAVEDWFGAAVDIDGDIAVVGAVMHDHLGPQSNEGRAFVFRVSTGQQLFELAPMDPEPADLFGRSIGISGGRILVGAMDDDDKGTASGSAYLFDAATGAQVFKLTASDGTTGDAFGQAASIDGTIIVVGAPGHNILKGAAYVFNMSTGQQIAKLLAADGAPGDRFGSGVEVSGNRAIVAAPNGGAAYLFDTTTGQQIAKLTPPSSIVYAVGILGNRAIVGTPLAAYVYDAVSGAQLMTLTPASGQAGPGTAFGAWVGLTSNCAYVGAHALQSGSVHVFDLANGQQVATLGCNDPTMFKSFGFWGGLSNGNAIFGAVGDMTYGLQSGAAYLFTVEGPDPILAYGAGCGGTGGIVPSLAASGSATPGGQLQIAITNGVGSGSAFIVIGTQLAATPMRFGCTLNVQPLLPAIIGPILLFPFGAQGPGTGSISFSVSIPSNIAVPATATLQAFVVDAGAPAGYSNTNGIQLNIE